MQHDINQKTPKPRRVPLPRFYLLERRAELGLSVEEVSRRLKVTHYYYYQLENGNRGTKLAVKMLLNLTAALEITADKLLEFETQYIDKYNDLNNIM